MKTLLNLVFIAFVYFPANATAQKLIIDTSTLTAMRQKKVFEQKVKFNIKNIADNTPVKVIITDINSGSASRNNDYVLKMPNNITVTDTGHIAIIINPDTIKKNVRTVIFKLQASYNKDGHELQFADSTYTLNIKPYKETSLGKTTYRIDSTEVRILTAGSLNFYGQQQFSKYVGQLDIRLPQLFNSDWGLNTGIYTKNYYADSAYRGTGQFNISRPNDTVNYNYKKIARYANIVYDIYGAYANITRLIFKNDQADETGHLRVYFDASVEVQSTTIKNTYRYYTSDSTIQKYNTKVTVNNVLSPTDIRIIQPTSTESLISGYYGVGPQIYFQQDKLVDLNLLFLTGYSVTSLNSNQGTPLYSQSANSKQWFYFAKGVVTEKITKLNATIGVEVRGMFPYNTPSIAAYLGFLISPSDFFKKPN